MHSASSTQQGPDANYALDLACSLNPRNWFQPTLEMSGSNFFVNFFRAPVEAPELGEVRDSR